MAPLWTKEYRALIRARAKELGSDGCSGPALEIYQDACYEHDIHYRTGKTLAGQPITRAEADRLLRLRIQTMSKLGLLSPVSWWRWAAVRIFARGSWQGQ